MCLVRYCPDRHLHSTAPIVCGFRLWCHSTCEHYPSSIRAIRIDPQGNIQARLHGRSKRWIKEAEWMAMTDREAWNSIEDWEVQPTSDRKDSDAGKTSTRGGTKMKNVTHVSGETISEPQNGAYDVVNRPAHYNNGDIECIDAIKAATSIPGMTPFQGFLAGNVMKYLWRHGLKGNPEQDLAKAEWYLCKLKNSYSGGRI